MILARDSTGAVVDAAVAERGTAYACPSCEVGPLVLKQGPVVVAHFAHPPSAECSFENEPETVEHITGKRLIAERFDARLEQRIGPRRADAVSERHRFVFEVQVSPIGLSEYRQRNIDYNAAGYAVAWIWSLGLISAHNLNADEYRVPLAMQANAVYQKKCSWLIGLADGGTELVLVELRYTRWLKSVRIVDFLPLDGLVMRRKRIASGLVGTPVRQLPERTRAGGLLDSNSGHLFVDVLRDRFDAEEITHAANGRQEGTRP